MNPLQRLLLYIARVPVPIAPLKPVNVASHEIDLMKWRQSESNVAASMQLAKHHTYLAQLGVLECEHPRYLALKIDVPLEQRAILQARAEGYQMCLNNLQAMSKPLKVNARVEATFEAPERNAR